MRLAGHEILTVGNAKKGFSLKKIKKALQKNPDIKTIFIDAHGNFDKRGHYLSIKEGRKVKYIRAKKLYNKLAKFSGGRPLNIFINSCGSSNSCVEAVKHLPLGSTLISYSGEGKLESYSPSSEAYKVTSEPDKNFAEEVFLSLLCKGFGDAQNYPHVSISRYGDDPWLYTYSLWDAVKGDIGGEDPENSTFRKYAYKRLGRYASRKAITMAFSTIELCMKRFEVSTLTIDKTPVTLKFEWNAESFHADSATHELLGVMSAIGYLTIRKNMGAFQLWHKDKYKEAIPERPMPELDALLERPHIRAEV